MNVKTRGYACGIIAASTYGMNPLFALPLYGAGLNPVSVLFFRYLLAIPLLLAMLTARGHSPWLSGRQVLPIALLGIIVAVSSLSLFESYNYMAAGIASTLLFIYPVMVAVIMGVVYKERLSPVTIVSIVVALAGIVMLYKGPEGSTLSLAGTALVIVSALTYAFYLVAVNRQPYQGIPTLKITLWVLVFGLTVFLGCFAAGTPVKLPPADGLWLWGNLIALAVLPTAVSFACTNVAIQDIGSTPTAILGALEPVTAVIIGVTVFDEMMTFREVVGLVMIITAVTAVIAGGRIVVPFLRIRRMFPRRRAR